MNNSHQETEVKLFTPNLEEIQRRLEENGAVRTADRVYEQNVRFEDEAHSLSQRGIVVRLRTDTRARLTYKEPGGLADGIVSRTELEVEVSDFDTMYWILTKLGYTPYLRYEKYRTTYQLHNTEVVLDEMPYGSFTEIEGDRRDIEHVLALLDLSDARRIPHSYTRLFDFVCRRLGLQMQNLTFENFAGITVPESAFYPPNS